MTCMSMSGAFSRMSASGQRRFSPRSSVFRTGDGSMRMGMVATTPSKSKRGFKGPRAIDISGIPLHQDDQTVIKERISLDKTDHNLLRDEITVIDNALTRPWTVT